MMGEEKAKDQIGASNMMKRHQGLEGAVEDYADVVRQLGERSRNLIETEHPERWVCVMKNTFFLMSVHDGIMSIVVYRLSTMNGLFLF